MLAFTFATGKSIRRPPSGVKSRSGGPGERAAHARPVGPVVAIQIRPPRASTMPCRSQARRRRRAQRPRGARAGGDHRGMTESNVERARRGYAAALRGDLDAIGELLDADVSWHGGDPSAPGSCHDRGQALEFIRRAFGRGGVGELVDVVGAGDRVVVIMRPPAEAGEPPRSPPTSRPSATARSSRWSTTPTRTTRSRPRAALRDEPRGRGLQPASAARAGRDGSRLRPAARRPQPRAGRARVRGPLHSRVPRDVRRDPAPLPAAPPRRAGDGAAAGDRSQRHRDLLRRRLHEPRDVQPHVQRDRRRVPDAPTAPRAAAAAVPTCFTMAWTRPSSFGEAGGRDRR